MSREYAKKGDHLYMAKSFDDIVPDHLTSISMVLSLLVTKLNSDLKESLHKDLKSVKNQIVGLNKHISQQIC